MLKTFLILFIKLMGIILRPPYTSDTCEGEGRALDRIKQVLDRFNQRKENFRSMGNTVTNSQGKSWEFMDQSDQLSIVSNTTSMPSKMGKSVFRAGSTNQPSMNFAPIPYMPTEDLSTNCHAVSSYPLSTTGNQPVMFLNPASTQNIEEMNIAATQQGANGVMLIFLQNPDECLGEAQRPMFLPNQVVPDHRHGGIEPHAVHNVVVYPGFNKATNQMHPTLNTEPLGLDESGEPLSNVKQFHSKKNVYASQPVPLITAAQSTTTRYYDGGRPSVSNSIHLIPPPATARGSVTTSVDAQNSHLFTPASVQREHSCDSKPNLSTTLSKTHCGISQKNGNSPVNSLASVKCATDARSATTVYQRSNSNVGSSNSKYNSTTNPLPVVAAPAESDAPQYLNSQASAKPLYTDHQSTHGTNRNATGATGTTPQDTSAPVSPYNHAPHSQQRFTRVPSTGSRHLHDSHHSGRSRWNFSMRQQGNNVHNFSGPSSTSNSKNHSQQHLRGGSVYSTLPDDTHRSTLPPDSSLSGNLNVSGNLASSGDHHHHRQNNSSIHYNHANHSNYRPINEGKTNRSQRNRGGGNRRRDAQ
ncbi:uncharacterized protein LOC128883300 isoform X2 [Hylaeus volcanicus]|uniref:uncharacterized protein LOC128883300 isoform X2 n=1 Tax=Hylaeus volcanicus TaxID=313075 RepID=UPI0023B7BBC4|nr:uncharacterized protein LOC128883300 isoform X2 [Hylaeus volcanicus]